VSPHLSDDELAVLAARVLAETSFLLAEPAADVPGHEDWSCALVTFQGAVRGRLVVAVPAGVAARVAADTLLVAPADERALLHSGNAVADLAGVIAGALLPALFEASGPFRIGLPSVVAGEPPLAPGERANRVTLVNGAGQPVRVELVLGNDAFSA
jgi:hypothetical protein